MPNEQTVEAQGLDRISAEIKGIEKNLMPLLDKQAEEIKRHGETASATSAAVKDLEAKYDERLKDLDAARTELKELKSEIAEGRVPGAKREPLRSAGTSFLESDAYKAALQANRDDSSPVEVKTFHERKALLTDAALASDLVGHLYPAQRQPGIVTQPERDLHIRDLLPVTPTTAGIIEYVSRTGGRWTAEVQESEGAQKKEQALTFEIAQAAPVTIAHWVPVTRQIIRRAAQLQAYIDNELMYGVRLAEDEQLLYGDGSAGSLQGLLTNANVQDYNAAGTAAAGDTRIDTVRRAITLLRLLFYRPTGVVVHPNDWEAIELQKDDEKRYIWVTVTDGGAPRLWRVPVIDTPAIEQDTFLLGDFSMGANLWDLETARVSTGFINDDFIRNRLAILGEEDVIFTTEHPKAFVKGDFGAVSS